MKETKKTFLNIAIYLEEIVCVQNLTDISSKHFVLQIQRHDALIIRIKPPRF